jgi:hypothetical protein
LLICRDWRLYHSAAGSAAHAAGCADGQLQPGWADMLPRRGPASVRTHHVEGPTMKAEKDVKYELKLTPQQQAEIKELTGRDGTMITFEIEELEERIAPKLAAN